MCEKNCKNFVYFFLSLISTADFAVQNTASLEGGGAVMIYYIEKQLLKFSLTLQRQSYYLDLLHLETVVQILNWHYHDTFITYNE